MLPQIRYRRHSHHLFLLFNKQCRHSAMVLPCLLRLLLLVPPWRKWQGGALVPHRCQKRRLRISFTSMLKVVMRSRLDTSHHQTHHPHISHHHQKCRVPQPKILFLSMLKVSKGAMRNTVHNYSVYIHKLLMSICDVISDVPNKEAPHANQQQCRIIVMVQS